MSTSDIRESRELMLTDVGPPQRRVSSSSRRSGELDETTAGGRELNINRSEGAKLHKAIKTYTNDTNKNTEITDCENKEAPILLSDMKPTEIGSTKKDGMVIGVSHGWKDATLKQEGNPSSNASHGSEKRRREIFELKLGCYRINCLSRALADDETSIQPLLYRRMLVYIAILAIVVFLIASLVWVVLRYCQMSLVLSVLCPQLAFRFLWECVVQDTAQNEVDGSQGVLLRNGGLTRQ
jgi:hypothetical protein